MNNEEKLNYFLENQYKSISEWLKFAEAKNASIIVFNITLSALVLSSTKKYTCVINLNYFIMILIILSTIIALCSFVAKLNNYKKPMKNIDEGTNENLIFFNNYINYTPETLLKKISKKYNFSSDVEFTEYQIDMAEELIVNSKIAKRKYKLFNVSIGLMIFTIIILGILVLSNMCC